MRAQAVGRQLRSSWSKSKENGHAGGKGREQRSTRESETSVEVVKCSVVWHTGMDSVRR